MAAVSDETLSTSANTIGSETLPKANTAERIGDMFTDLIDSKVNRDESSAVMTQKTALSSADVLALNSTPVVVVPAPGAGFLIQPLFITVRVNYVSATYAGNVLMQIRYDTISGNISTNTFIAASATTVSRQGLTTSISFSPSPENKALIIDVSSGNPTTGDSTIDVYITYALLTL